MIRWRGRPLLGLFVLVGAASCLPRAASRTPEAASAVKGDASGEALRALVDAHLAHAFRAFPVMATAYGVHDHDGELRGYTPEERAAHVSRLRADLEALKRTVDPARLTPLERADHAVFEGALQSQLLLLTEVRTAERDPNESIELAGSAVYGLIIRDFAPLEQRMKHAVARMARIPDVFATAQRVLGDTPRLWTEIALEQAAGTRALYAETLPQAFAPVKDPALQEAFRREQARCLEAIDRYRVFLQQDLLPRSTGQFAIGEELYRRRLLHEEGVTEPIDALLAWGQAELARTQQQFKELAARIDPSKPPPEVYRALGKEHPTAAQLVPTTRALLEDLRSYLIEKRIITVPSEVRALVAETPIFARAFSFASMSIPGPFETRATEAYYYVTPPEPSWTPEQQDQHLAFYNAYSLPLISTHEAYPGHYLQFLWTNKVDSKARRMWGSGAFAEGWGLYTEQMILDEGYGGTGPRADRLRLAQLSMYLLRLCRYMVGLSLHTRGMTYDEAVRFFEEQAYMSRVTAEREARRGTVDPTYLVYALGKKMILELREEAKQRWGDGYSLQRFHDTFVSFGYPPIPVARRLMFNLPAPNPEP